MNDLFKTEEEAIIWVKFNIPIVISPKKQGKTDMVDPFSSGHAFSVVCEELGKSLFKLQEKSKIESNKDL